MFKFFVLIFFILSLEAWATNGVNLTSSSVRGLGVAGNGISHLYSVGDALIKNPATLTKIKDTTFETGVIGLLPDVKSRNKVMSTDFKRSEIQFSPIPTLAMALRQQDYAFGFGLIPVAGLASDFRNDSNLFELAPQLSVLNAPLAVARSWNDFAFGISLSPSIGSASINSSKNYPTHSQSKRNPNYQISWNYILGMQYRPSETIEVGVSYKSPTYFKFKKQTDLESYVGIFGTSQDDLEVEIPAEYGLGLSYTHDWGVFSLENKLILWEQARGFQSYDWKNQNVVSLSWFKPWNRFALSLGYAYSQAVFESKSNEDGTKPRSIGDSNLTQQNISYFNVIGYPAILKHHLSAGAQYKLSPALTLDSSLLYCPKENIKRSGNGFLGAYEYETEISLAFINIGITKTW